MIDLSLLPDGGMPWLDGSGASSHLVLSTRVRLARNLADRPFGARSTPAERETILSEVEDVARQTVSLRRAHTFALISWSRPTVSCFTSGTW